MILIRKHCLNYIITQHGSNDDLKGENSHSYQLSLVVRQSPTVRSITEVSKQANQTSLWVLTARKVCHKRVTTTDDALQITCTIQNGLLLSIYQIRDQCT